MDSVTGGNVPKWTSMCVSSDFCVTTRTLMLVVPSAGGSVVSSPVLTEVPALGGLVTAPVAFMIDSVVVSTEETVVS